MFSEKFRVRFSECDSAGKLTFPALVNFFQDVACDHYLDAGYGTFRVRGMGYYWVLLSWDIEIESLPLADTTVEVITYVNRNTKNFAVRSFEMKDEAGNILTRATSNWVICDVKTDHMTTVPQELIDAITIDAYAPLPRMPLTIHIGELPQTPITVFPVTRKHLDLNGHINNVNYIRFLLDELDRTRSVRRLQICYLAASHEGEHLSIFRREEDGSFAFRTKNESGECKTEARIWLN